MSFPASTPIRVPGKPTSEINDQRSIPTFLSPYPLISNDPNPPTSRLPLAPRPISRSALAPPPPPPPPLLLLRLLPRSAAASSSPPPPAPPPPPPPPPPTPCAAVFSSPRPHHPAPPPPPPPTPLLRRRLLLPPPRAAASSSSSPPHPTSPAFSSAPLARQADSCLVLYVINPLDRIPESRFSLPRRPGDRCRFLGCHHGLALLDNLTRCEAVVWDPVTGDELCVSYPPGFEYDPFNGAVMRAAVNDGHLSPFKLVLGYTDNHTSAFFCLYESESGVWGNIISTTITRGIRSARPSILVGNALYCMLLDGNILEFDLDRQSLAVIDKPGDASKSPSFQILRTEESELGLAVLTELSIELWERKANSDGVVRWLLQKTVQLDKLLSLGFPSESAGVLIVGYDEDTNVILLSTVIGVFMVQLESLRLRSLSNSDEDVTYYPYRNFYTAEKNGSKKERNMASK